MRAVPEAVTELAARLALLSWVRDLWVAGSVATGDHVPGVSDLDLVAMVDGPVDAEREARLVDLHRELDRGRPRVPTWAVCTSTRDGCLTRPPGTRPGRTASSCSASSPA